MFELHLDVTNVSDRSQDIDCFWDFDMLSEGERTCAHFHNECEDVKCDFTIAPGVTEHLLLRVAISPGKRDLALDFTPGLGTVMENDEDTGSHVAAMEQVHHIIIPLGIDSPQDRYAVSPCP